MAGSTHQRLQMPPSPPPRRWLVHLGALAGYAGAAVLFHWPLLPRFDRALTGPVTGDTAVYVWNQWVFRHEIVEHARLPLFTQEILSLSAPVDLSLHNYTLFSNLLAFPLIPLLGVVGTFNIVYLLLAVLTGWGMFLLARELTGRSAESFLAGLLFAFSPVLIARGTAHFSLAAAAPLPIFLWCLIRAERECTTGRAVAVGLTMGWAALCDAYFGVYCVLLGGAYLAARRMQLSRLGSSATPPRRTARALDGLIVVLAALVLVIVVSGGGEVTVLGVHIAARSLYTPVLLLTVAMAARAWLMLRPTLSVRWARPTAQGAWCLALATAACLLLVSPVLYALSFRLRDGGALHQTIFWRSSPPGVDLTAFFMPNPTHALIGDPWREWLIRQPGGFAESVAALSVVALITVGLAVWRFRFRPDGVWVALLALFGALALGPFVHVAGINTYIPGPWAFLRYVPLLSAARSPARFSIVAALLFAVVFATALVWMSGRAGRRRLVLAGVAGALAFELAPLPRETIAAPIPDLYRIVRDDPRDIRVLELPFGVRDGERSEGNFTAASQFYQTFHQKPIIGGYLSRVSDNEFGRQRRIRLLSALMQLSEGRTVDDLDLTLGRAKRIGPRFARRNRLGYVVMDSLATSPDLRHFAIEAFELEKIAEGEGRELYRPRAAIPKSDLGPGQR